jgi:DNA-binding transcriptional LysR family regulator
MMMAMAVEVRGSISVNNAEMLRQAALDGLGMVMLADWLIQDDLDAGKLVAVLTDYQVNPAEMDVGIYAVYPANRRGATKIQVFTNMLAASLDLATGEGLKCIETV